MGNRWGNSGNSDRLYFFPLNIPDVRNWQFRIEYIPMTSKTKIRARKNAETTEEYIQPFNQRAEINAASAFGKSMYLTAQKTGTEEIAVVRRYFKLKDIPPLGSLVVHNGKRYRLTANSYSMTNTVFIQVTHLLSQNWTNKSKHISVDQKFRNWNIPRDMLWRNLYWEDYFIASKTKPNDEDMQDKTGNVPISGILMVLEGRPQYIGYPVRHAFFYKGKTTEYGVTLPCSTMGIANSLCFSFSMKDNLSAGLYKNGDYCDEAFYCGSAGTLENARIILSNGISNYNQDLLPKAIETYNKHTNAIFDKTFVVLKDPGEALKFTYQIHGIGKEEIFFGEKFFENNTTIKTYDENIDIGLKLILAKNYIRDGIDKYIESAGDLITDREEAFYISERETALEFEDTIKRQMESGDYKAWVIVDKDNYIYLASNDITTQRVYFSFSHEKK